MTTEKRKLAYLILVIMTVFLMINRFMIVELGILIVLFLTGFSRNNRIMRFSHLEKSIGLIALYSAFTIVLGVLPGFSPIFNLGSAITEIERAVIYILVIQIVSTVRINLRQYQRVWRVILLIVVGLCIVQYLRPFDINSFLMRLYGDTVQFLNSAETGINSFRGGSVFVNPNVMACFLVGYLGNYLVLLPRTNDRAAGKTLNFVLVLFGLILSGSRTGMVIAGIELLLLLMLRARARQKNYLVRILAFGSILLAAIVVLFNSAIPDLGGLRAFQVNEGLSNSLLHKLTVWSSIMGNAHAGNYLFGFGPIEYATNADLLVDFELGYFTVFYGLIGVFLFIRLVRSMMRFRTGPGEADTQKARNLSFAMIMALFGFTAGVYLNLRLFSVLIALFFPVLNDSSEKEDDHNEQIRTA